MFKVLFILTLIAECALVPLFLHYYWPTKNKYSFTTKTIASVLFIICGLLVSKISGNNTLYADFIIWGLVFGCVGDVMLHSLANKMWHFAVGVVAFLVGHVFYIIAIQKAIFATYPGSNAIEWYEVVLVVLLLSFVIAFCIYRKEFQKNAPRAVGLLVYGSILGFMFVKAWRYAIGEIVYGTNDNMAMVAFTIGVGATLFIISDLILGYIISQGEGNTKRGMRIVNIVTYYVAQILIACSIFFVESRELL